MVTIKDSLDSFASDLKSLIAKHFAAFEKKIIMGYKSFAFTSRKSTIIDCVNSFNTIMKAYCELLDCGKPSLKIYNEVVALLNTGPDKIENGLKVSYLKCRKVSVPNFKFKMNLMAEAYDFTAEESKLIDLIVEHRTTVSKIKDISLEKYWNDSKSGFEFGDSDEASLLEEYTIYATQEKLSKVISLELFCVGLSNLKTPDWSFKELPEIPYEVVQLIKADLDDRMNEVGICVDLDRINNSGEKPNITGVTQELSSFKITFPKKATPEDKGGQVKIKENYGSVVRIQE